MSFEELILDKITAIERHVGILNDEYGIVAARLAVLESQMADIQWLLRLVLGAIILSLVGSLLSLVWIRKNNK